jgi:hypothetical protein
VNLIKLKKQNTQLIWIIIMGLPPPLAGVILLK